MSAFEILFYMLLLVIIEVMITGIGIVFTVVGVWIHLNPWIVGLPFAIAAVLFMIKCSFKEGRFNLRNCSFLSIFPGIVALTAYSCKLVAYCVGTNAYYVADCLWLVLVGAFLVLLLVAGCCDVYRMLTGKRDRWD